MRVCVISGRQEAIPGPPYWEVGKVLRRDPIRPELGFVSPEIWSSRAQMSSGPKMCNGHKMIVTYHRTSFQQPRQAVVGSLHCLHYPLFLDPSVYEKQRKAKHALEPKAGWVQITVEDRVILLSPL